MNNNRMTEEQAQKLYNAVTQALALQGDPNEALAKVASEHKLTIPFIERLVEAYNVSRNIEHRKTASDKASSFPIADPKVVIERIYSNSEDGSLVIKQSSFCISSGFYEDDWFYKEPDETPLSKPQRNPAALSRLVKIAEIVKGKARRLNDYFRTESAIIRERLLGNIKCAMDYFRQVYHEPFDRVEGFTLAKYGSWMKPVFDVVYAGAGLTKSAHDKRAAGPVGTIVIDDNTPYRIFEKIHNDLQEYKNLKQSFTLKKSSKFLEFPLSDTLMLDTIKNVLKKPDIYKPDVYVTESIRKEYLPTDKTEKKIKVLLDADHIIENDPVLSKADPAKVRVALYKAVDLLPEASENPEVLRSVTYKLLHSEALDPIDVEALQRIEQSKQKLDYEKQRTITEGLKALLSMQQEKDKKKLLQRTTSKLNEQKLKDEQKLNELKDVLKRYERARIQKERQLRQSLWTKKWHQRQPVPVF